MKKKLSILVFFISSISYSQYSNYYTVNSNVNANINQNITGNVNVNKTISTIDYGALAQANAQYERNRLERAKYENEEQRRIALEIAADPSKAYDYSKRNFFRYNNIQKRERGLKKRFWCYQHSLEAGKQSIYNWNSGVWSNISKDFITSELIDYGLISTDWYNKEWGNELGIDANDPETHVTFLLEAGKEYDISDFRSGIWGGGKAYIHKVEVNRAKVRGYNGFKGTIVYETKYEKGIVDYYKSVSNGNILSQWKVVTKGNSNEITFEELEGRRYYLRLLNEKQIANSMYNDLPYRID